MFKSLVLLLSWAVGYAWLGPCIFGKIAVYIHLPFPGNGVLEVHPRQRELSTIGPDVATNHPTRAISPLTNRIGVAHSCTVYSDTVHVSQIIHACTSDAHPREGAQELCEIGDALITSLVYMSENISPSD